MLKRMPSATAPEEIGCGLAAMGVQLSATELDAVTRALDEDGEDGTPPPIAPASRCNELSLTDTPICPESAFPAAQTRNAEVPPPHSGACSAHDMGTGLGPEPSPPTSAANKDGSPSGSSATAGRGVPEEQLAPVASAGTPSHQSLLLTMCADSSRLIQLSEKALPLVDLLLAGLPITIDRISTHDDLVRSFTQRTRIYLHRCTEEQRQAQQFVERLVEVEKSLSSADAHKLDVVLTSLPVPAIPSFSPVSEISEEIHSFIACLAETCATHQCPRLTHEYAISAVEQMESLLYSLDHCMRTMVQLLPAWVAGGHGNDTCEVKMQIPKTGQVLSDLIEKWSPNPSFQGQLAQVLCTRHVQLLF
jgi:hypothetical protein